MLHYIIAKIKGGGRKVPPSTQLGVDVACVILPMWLALTRLRIDVACISMAISVACIAVGVDVAGR